MCPWKGCRAPSLSTKVRGIQAEIEALRMHVDDADAVGLDTPDETRQVFTRMLGIFHLKFAFVEELPYVIWECGHPAGATKFLQLYDAQLAAGEQPHRVSVHFASEGSALRADMEEHAKGQPMTDTLAREVAAYAFCMLDDTWVEAGHRDVSKLQESRPKAKLHYLAASLRLDQNLEVWDDTEGDNREFLASCYRKYRAMGHLLGQRQPQRRRRKHRMTPKQTASQRFILNIVYRLKQASRTDWSGRLRDILPPCCRWQRLRTSKCKRSSSWSTCNWR